jgi:hypothetical protein
MAAVNESGIKTYTAAEALAADRRVRFDANGAIVYADANEVALGFTIEAAASGEDVAVKLKNFPGTRRAVCADTITLGAPVYGAADGKVDDAIGSTGPQIGIALEAGAAGGTIEIQPEEGGTRLLHSINTVSDAAGASSASLVVFSNGSVTIPAGLLRTGDVLRVKAVGDHPATNSSDTATVRLRVNTEVVATTPNPDAVNDDVFMIDADITLREVSATGKIIAQGYVMNDALAAGLATPFYKPEAAEDISGAITIDVSVQWSASAANESRLRRFTVELIRK